MTVDLKEIFASAAREQAFPGGSVALRRGRNALEVARGTTAYADAGSRPVTGATLYDIASLTKAYTCTAFLIAAAQHGADVDQPVGSFLPQFGKGEKRLVLLRHLLNHSSGIALAVQKLVDVSCTLWVDRIAEAPLETAPGASVRYSCTNFFLLARIIEVLGGKGYDEFLKTELFDPLALQNTVFDPLTDCPAFEIAPTEIEAATGRPWRGIVHDEAARAWVRAMGTCCGNSGIFATATDVARLMELWAQGGRWNDRELLSPGLVDRALCETVPEGVGRRGWCWQLDAPHYMSESAPPNTAGHIGFTGPTACFNRATGDFVVILENRVYPTRNGPNRFPYHRRIMEALYAQG